MTRQEIATYSQALLAVFDAVKDDFDISRDEMLVVLAATLAALPDPPRAVFRAAFDQIEREMELCRPPEASARQ